MRKNTKRSAAVVAAAVVAVGGGAAAWAAWTANTTGSAAASTGSAAAVQITGTPTVTPALLPGNKASVQVSVKNPNGFHVKVKNIEITSITTTKSGCSSSNFTFTKPGISAATLNPVGAGDTKSFTLTNAVSLKDDPSNDCQNAALTVNFKVDAESTEPPTANPVAPANPGAPAGAADSAE